MGLSPIGPVFVLGCGCPQGSRRCEKIAALPPDVRKGSAFPSTRLNTKAFRLGRLPESRRLSAHQAAQPQQPATAIFSHLLVPWANVFRPFGPETHVVFLRRFASRSARANERPIVSPE